ncbi:MAG: hypothetical protein Q9M26_01325 [Mariprofundales bacterium]|nr:hypothetical protein [Mariprofundales bacterium]
MTRATDKLSAMQVKQGRLPDGVATMKLADGAGMYLLINGAGKYWRLVTTQHPTRKWL